MDKAAGVPLTPSIAYNRLSASWGWTTVGTCLPGGS